MLKDLYCRLYSPLAFLWVSVSLTEGAGLPPAWPELSLGAVGRVGGAQRWIGSVSSHPGSVILQLLVLVQGTLTRRHQFSSETPHARISFLKEGKTQ